MLTATMSVTSCLTVRSTHGSLWIARRRLRADVVNLVFPLHNERHNGRIHGRRIAYIIGLCVPNKLGRGGGSCWGWLRTHTVGATERFGASLQPVGYISIIRSPIPVTKSMLLGAPHTPKFLIILTPRAPPLLSNAHKLPAAHNTKTPLWMGCCTPRF